MPSLINLRRRIAEVGGALGPPIVKGGTPREARRENRTLKQEDPCDRLAPMNTRACGRLPCLGGHAVFIKMDTLDDRSYNMTGVSEGFRRSDEDDRRGEVQGAVPGAA